MGARRRAREQVLEALYAFHVTEDRPFGSEPLELSASVLASTLADLRACFEDTPRNNERDRDGEASAGPSAEAKEDEQYAVRLLKGVLERLPEVDGMISSASPGWRVDRMDVVDLCLIRMAVYELAFFEDVPAAVSINEAVDLARKYGNANSPAFVNGVADRVRKDLGPGPGKQEEPTKNR